MSTVTLTQAAARQIRSQIATPDLARLNGACLDFVTDGLKQSFQFDNPHVGNTCGCGESFSLKAGSGKGGAA